MKVLSIASIRLWQNIDNPNQFSTVYPSKSVCYFKVVNAVHYYQFAHRILFYKQRRKVYVFKRKNGHSIQ